MTMGGRERWGSMGREGYGSGGTGKDDGVLWGGPGGVGVMGLWGGSHREGQWGVWGDSRGWKGTLGFYGVTRLWVIWVRAMGWGEGVVG